MDKKKVKYYENNLDKQFNSLNSNQPGKLEAVGNESELIMPANSVSNFSKNLFEYEELNPKTYNTPLKVSEINIKKQFSNYYGHHTGPGKGFGNLSVSNDKQ